MFEIGDVVYMDNNICLTFEVDSEIANNQHVVQYMQDNEDSFVVEDEHFYLFIPHQELAHFIHITFLHSEKKVAVVYEGVDPYVDQDGEKIHQQYCHLIEVD